MSLLPQCECKGRFNLSWNPECPIDSHREMAIKGSQRGDGKQQEARACQYCDSDDWSKRYLSNQCPDTYPEGIWLHKKGNLTMPCNLQPPARQASQPSQVSGEPGQERFPHWESAYQLHKRENILMGEAVERVVREAVQAMAEKAAQLVEHHGNLIVGDNKMRSRFMDTAKDIRFLAGAEPVRPEGCICSEAYGVGPEKCGKHGVEPPGKK